MTTEDCLIMGEKEIAKVLNVTGEIKKYFAKIILEQSRELENV